MMRVRRKGGDIHRDRWMVSYMDVLTILLIFFVAAASQSTMPRPEKAAKTEPVHVVSETQERLETMGLDVKREARGLIISLPQAVLFASGDDAISAKARPMVAKISRVLREIPNRVGLEGHADAVPIHNRRFKNNWELAAARSLRLREMLGAGGVEESRLSVASYGSSTPKDSNQTADGRASNRRVEIVIMDEPRLSGVQAARP